MRKRRSASQALGPRGQALIRIVIASYFIAGALGLIAGVDLTTLFEQALPAPIEGIAPAASVLSVLILSMLILSGHWLRPAALLLSIAMFWSSYLEMMALGVSDQLGQFWRDLALIGALMLTYAEPADRRDPVAKLLKWKPKPRRVLGEPVAPRRVGIERDRTHDPIRMPRRDGPVAVPVPGPEPVFYTRRQKPVMLRPEMQGAEPAAQADEDNIFIDFTAHHRAS